MLDSHQLGRLAEEVMSYIFEHCELEAFPDLPDKDTQDWSLDGSSGLEENILQ